MSAKPILYHIRRSAFIPTVGFETPNDPRRVYGISFRNIVGRAWGAGQTLSVLHIYNPNVAPARDFILLAAHIAFFSASVATILEVSLRWAIAAPTGGGAGAPQSFSPNGPATEKLAMLDPTSAVPANSPRSYELSLGVTGAASVVNPPPPLLSIDLSPPLDLRVPIPSVGANPNRGWALCINSSVAATLKYWAEFIYAEPDLGLFL